MSDHYQDLININKFTILARWCRASWAVTGSAFGGSTPSETPGTTTLARILILALRLIIILEALRVARSLVGEELLKR